MLDMISEKLREGNVWVIFYSTRSKTGSEDQRWAEDVYLTDHWEICWTKDEAIKNYEKLFDKYSSVDIHNAGIAPIDPEYNTGW